MAIEDDLFEDDIDENYIDEEKRNKWLLICIIILLVMTLPSTLAFLAIF